MGIQGAFWTSTDANDEDPEGNSSIEPENFAGSGDTICANGTIGQVLAGADGQPDYSAHWGALIGFNLSQEEGDDTPLAYNATAHGVVGFSFVVAGSSPLPPEGELRFSVRVAGSSQAYCRRVPTAGLNSFRFIDLWQSCWEGDATLPTPDPTQLQTLHWQYVSTSTSSYDFDLCITDLHAIVERD